MEIDLNKLKELAQAVRGTVDHPARDAEWTAFRYAACPTTILALIAQLEQLQADLRSARTDYGLLKIDHEHTKRNFEQADKCAHEREGQILELLSEAERLRALIPAPASSADTPKCGTCAAKIDPERFIREAADKAAVWSSDCRNIRVLPMSALDTILITLDAMQRHSKPYEDSRPDCTPARAEQKCVCGKHSETSKLACALFATGPAGMINCFRCGHSRACHEGATP